MFNFIDHFSYLELKKLTQFLAKRVHKWNFSILNSTSIQSLAKMNTHRLIIYILIHKYHELAIGLEVLMHCEFIDKF